MKLVYLVAAIIGAIVPYVFFVQHFADLGYSLGAFLAAGYANPVAGGAFSDLLISSFVFWIYMFTRGEGAPRPWLFVILNLAIGLSCALPAYLYWREKTAPAPRAMPA